MKSDSPKRLRIAIGLVICLPLAYLLYLGPEDAEFAKPTLQIRLVQKSAGANTEEMLIKDQDRTTTLHVEKEPLMDHRAVASARMGRHFNAYTGRREIEVTLTDKGRERFAEVTRTNIGRQLAIVVEGQLLSAPRIAEEIRGGKLVISGNFSEKEVGELAARISAAAKE